MRKLKILLLFICVSSLFGNLFAQYDSLFVFTKQTCSNCKLTKRTFNENQIGFKEYALENKANADVMLTRLNEIGYRGKMYLPIVFLNEELIYPATMSQDTFVRASLSKMLDSISYKANAGQLLFPEPLETKSVSNTSIVEHDKCEVEVLPIYLVSRNFKEKQDAEAYLQSLKSKGYTNSGLLYHQRIYRVYNKYFLDPIIAQKELKRQREANKMVYLLSPNE